MTASDQSPTVVFFDRDGTLIRDVHYLSRPEQVELLPGAAEAVARLNAAGIPVILVTNQSGIARGYFTVTDYERAHQRFTELLAARGARLDGAYYCPHAPGQDFPCECRKPATRLFRDAIAEHHLDPSRAVFIGDRWRDVSPALVIGGQGILVPSATTPLDEVERAKQDATVASTVGDAVDRILSPARVA